MSSCLVYRKELDIEKQDLTLTAYQSTWEHLFHPPIEGRIVQGFEGVDVGHRIRVKLFDTDVERGSIDFKRVG